MERIKELDRYQKGILLLLIAMLVLFSVIYYYVSSRVGFLYKDHILIPAQVDGNTVYEGEIEDEIARFTVTQGNSVTFQYGEKVYGPYTVTEDPAAIPAEDSRAGHMTGIVIRDGDEILFQGGYLRTGTNQSDFLLYNEDGWYPGITITITASDGTVVDGNGNVVDAMKPSIVAILKLVNGPELTSKGQWIGWFGGLFFSIITAVSILFADEIFRWNLAFRIQNVESAEPSEWALAERYIGWTIGAIGTLLIYITGLQ